MGKVKRERRLKRLREGAGEVPTSSFADIAFLLIIYFMVVTTLVPTQGMIADMPQGQKADNPDMDKVPIVAVADDRIVFNDTAMSLDGLREKLAGMQLKDQPEEDRVIMLEVTGSSGYELFYQAMAAINNAGGVIAMVEEAEED